MTDDGEVLACPECDKTPVVTNSTGGRNGGDCSKYRCPTCNAHFDEATVREDRGGPGIRNDSLAARLEDAEPGDLVTDGGVDQDDGEVSQGTTLCWDHEDCPRDDCDGELQQQDRFNVMCLSCEHVWMHWKDETDHVLETEDHETVARKPRVATDGGVDQDDGDVSHVVLNLTREEALTLHDYATHACKTLPEGSNLDRWKAIRSKTARQL